MTAASPLRRRAARGAALVALAFSAGAVASPARAVAFPARALPAAALAAPHKIAVPQKAITCPGSALVPLSRLGPGQLLQLTCSDGRKFLQVRQQGRPLAAMPFAELWPGGGWQLRDTPRVPVRTGARWVVPLLVKSAGGEAVVIVAADYATNELSVAYRGPPAVTATCALRDLDGDGIAELRLGLDDGKRRAVRTVTLREPAAEWTGTLAAPLGPAARALCGDEGDCDPVLDFDVETRKLPDAIYLFARGRDRLCGSGGCALVIARVAGGEGREVLRDFGLWTVGPALAGRPPCVTIRGRDEPPRKRCWQGKSYGGG